ncbi:unnamed protein product [Cylindrotheca closterium]|uniref:Prephenate dehydratase n=1 Tax=Cylindrotheca closterium TaxID=2856 RepID=A0AAD2FBV8_9STRA|nr:unnamed protein product [Cylindrotheca closterium]
MYAISKIHQGIALIYGALIVSRLQPAVAFSPQNAWSRKTVLSKTALNLRVAYQGEPGAYSQKATRELLGDQVVAIGRPSFESCFKAVANMEADFACLPVENSLGGSIHENYDLLFRYDLTVCAEHDFRVEHCVLAMEGVKVEDIKFAISHPQALAQCDNYLRGLGITPVPAYDTAGSAKMISEGKLPDLPLGMTQENTCAIASDLAGRAYGMVCLKKGAEDNDSNFTRFLLLGRKGIDQYLTKSTPSKTSVFFTLSDKPGALYKALACFSLRDIDFSKIESRPTSALLLRMLKFQRDKSGNYNDDASMPRFRYCFYLDFLSSINDNNAKNALLHLKEQVDYFRVLGSYPTNSGLVGPIADAVEELKGQPEVDLSELSLVSLPSETNELKPMNIGIVGFGSFGQSLAAEMKKSHRVSCMDQVDKSSDARRMEIDFYHSFERSKFLSGLDIVILAVPMTCLEECVKSLPSEELRGKLVVNVSPLLLPAKKILLDALQDFPDIDVVVSNPMFGGSIDPDTVTADLWDGRTMVSEYARVSNGPRCDRYEKIFKNARCECYNMESNFHDATIANSEFVTHLMGRLLNRQLLPPALISSKDYKALSAIGEAAEGDSFDRFFSMYKYNDKAKDYLNILRENLADIERQLAAREAYLEAKADMRKIDRQQLLAETRLLLQELAQGGTLNLPEAGSSSNDQQFPGDDGEASRNLTLDVK